METTRIENKRKASAVSEEETADFLLDDLKFEPSFLNDDLIDIPNLGPDSILTLDSGSDAFPGLDLFNDGNTAPHGDGNGIGAAGPLSLEDVFGSDDELADFLPGGRIGVNKVSPSTSESGNINEDRGAGIGSGGSGLPTTATAQGTESSGGASGAAASNPSNNNQEEDEAKKLARMQRNRENAYLSRQRKKQQMVELQTTCTQLRGQTTQLTCLVHRLVAENCLLRHHLGASCQKAGIPVPDVPSAMKPAVAPAAAAVPGTATAPGAVPVAQVRGLPGVPVKKESAGLLRPEMVPMVAQPQPLAAVTAPTAAAAAPAPPTTTASGRPVRSKRARVTGAGAAFLTLFSIFLFVGPMAPLTGRNATSSSSSSSSATSYLLPAGGLGSSDPTNQQLLGPITRSHAGARSLLQSASIEDSTTTDPLPLSASLVHQTVDSLLQDPRSQQLSAQALQRLQDLAPAAVVLDPNYSTIDDTATHRTGNTVPQSSNPLAASTAFPILANGFFKAAGLDAPQTCQKVFEFDASTLPHPARSRRSVERFITGAYGFKGRSIGLPDITGATATATGTTTTSSSTSGAAAFASKSGTKSSGTPLRLPSASSIIQEDSVESSLVVKALENEQRLHEYLHDDLSLAGDIGADSNGDKNEGDSTDLLPVAVNEPTLVSVLLPSNASQPGEGGLSAVDRVFVVLLHPGERFITYSCGLSRPLLV